MTNHSPLVGGVSCLAWSPRGDNVASGGREGLVSIWSAPEAGCGANGARHASLSCGAAVSALAWDGRVSWLLDGYHLSLLASIVLSCAFNVKVLFLLTSCLMHPLANPPPTPLQKADKVMLIGLRPAGPDRAATVRAWHSDTRRVVSDMIAGWAWRVGGLAGWRVGDSMFGLVSSCLSYKLPSGNPHCTTTNTVQPHPTQNARSPPGWSVTALACSPTEPLFVAATASPAAPAGNPSHPGLLASPPAASSPLSHPQSAPPRRGACGAWNLRAYKRSGSYTIPGEPAVTSLAFSRGGGLLAAGTETGRVALFDPASKPQPTRVWAAAGLADVGGGGVGGVGAVAVAFRGEGGGADGSLLTLRSGCVQEWSLANLRAPVAAIDVSAAAVAAAAAAGGGREQGCGGSFTGIGGSSYDSSEPDHSEYEEGDLGQSSTGGGGSGPWHFSMTVSPGGTQVAVACGSSSSSSSGGGGGGGGAPGARGGVGCVLLYDISGGVWMAPKVLFVSSLLAGRCTVDWHPQLDVLVCGSGAAGGSLLTLQLDPSLA